MQTGRPAKSKRSEFGARLHAAREARGFSQAQMAAKLGIAQQSYAAWERRDVALRADQVQRLADILGMKPDEFFGNGSAPVRRGGPTGRAMRAFEGVSKLPRSRQHKILDVVEAFLQAS